MSVRVSDGGREGGREDGKEGGRGGGADTELKTKTPHVNYYVTHQIMFNTHSKQPQASTSQPKTLAPKALALCILALVLCFSAVDRTRLWLLIKTMVCSPYFR